MNGARGCQTEDSAGCNINGIMLTAGHLNPGNHRSNCQGRNGCLRQIARHDGGHSHGSGSVTGENGGAKVGHGSGGMILLRAA